MEKTDLINFTKDEVDTIFTDLINSMEAKGKEYMKYYKESSDQDFDSDKYAYGVALLTRVNYINAILQHRKDEINK